MGDIVLGENSAADGFNVDDKCWSPGRVLLVGFLLCLMEDGVNSGAAGFRFEQHINCAWGKDNGTEVRGGLSQQVRGEIGAACRSIPFERG
jgi:hypothetical protein